MHRISAHVTFNQVVRNNNFNRQDEDIIFVFVIEHLHIYVTLNQVARNNNLSSNMKKHMRIEEEGLGYYY